MVFFGVIKNSRLNLYRAGDFELWLSTMEGKEISVDVKIKSKKRTNPQNAYYWKILQIAGREIGYTPEELHQTFKSKFNLEHKNYKGKELDIVKSTAKLNTAEFTEYLDNVIRELAELGISVLSPEEFYQTLN